MSHKIDPREVLTYLNELGYTNISAQQLKEFISDLKKLMKYESRRKKKSSEKENVDPTSNYAAGDYRTPCCTKPHCSCGKSVHNEAKQNDMIFTSLYNQPTVASKAKEVPRQERQISVHIIRPKVKTTTHDHCIHVEKQVEDDKGQLQFTENVDVTSDGSKLQINTESTIQSGRRPCSKQSYTSSSRAVRPRSSFIRSEFAKPVNKCDPVALYHYYQNEWKKQKFPGQETHSDLRWAVREKMLGGPKIDTTSRPSSCRRSCNSWKG